MNNLIQCRQCRVQKSCGSCFEPSSFARTRLASGMRSALCRVCYAKREQQPLNEIPLDIKMELETR